MRRLCEKSGDPLKKLANVFKRTEPLLKNGDAGKSQIYGRGKATDSKKLSESSGLLTHKNEAAGDSLTR